MMPTSISPTQQTPGVPVCAGSAGMLHSSVGWRRSRRADPRCPQHREPFEVQHPSDQERLLSDPWPPTSPEPSQPVPVLPFTEQLLDLFPAALRQPIRLAPAAVPHPTMRLGAPACVGGDVRFDPVLEQRLDELLLEEPLVAAEALGPKAEPPPGPPQQGQTSVSLGEQALEDLHADTQKDTVAVLHH